jgi:uncharacterized protein YigE (DUF2233 family)
MTLQPKRQVLYLFLLLSITLTGWHCEKNIKQTPDLSDNTTVEDGKLLQDKGEDVETLYLPLFAKEFFREKPFINYTIRPDLTDIRIFNARGINNFHTFESIDSVAKANELTLEFAMNGGMFLQNRQAKGLFIENGQTIVPLDTAKQGYGNFYMQPNGVFAIDEKGHAFIIPTNTFSKLVSENDIAYATQSGPMTIIDGKINSLFNDGSKNLYVRNAVGIKPDNSLVFTLSLEEVTFFELSSMLLSKGCTQGLYLDGFVSQVYIPNHGIGSLEKGDDLGPIIAVFSSVH